MITLGIIGVVAALTIPSLITKYEKKVAVTQLKKSYSLMSQLFQMSQLDNGEMSSWNITGAGQNIWDENNTYKDDFGKFLKKHIMPYLSVSKDCGYMNSNGCPVITTTRPSGVKREGHLFTERSYSFYTADGVRYEFALNNSSSGNYTNQVLISVDVNGDKKPNMWGKDVYMMLYTTLGHFRMFNYGFLSNEESLNGCKSGNGFECGWIIQQNNWQIPDNYGW